VLFVISFSSSPVSLVVSLLFVEEITNPSFLFFFLVVYFLSASYQISCSSYFAQKKDLFLLHTYFHL
jgi:hypothetical protein